VIFPLLFDLLSVSSSSGAFFFLFTFRLLLFDVNVGVGWLLSRALCGKLELGVGAWDGVVCDEGAGESWLLLVLSSSKDHKHEAEVGGELTLDALAELRLNIRSVSVSPPFLRVAVPPPALRALPLVPLM
jgi:hypothetical protein